MESGIGIQLEHESVAVDKTITGDPVLDVKKEEGEEVLGGNGDSENATNAESSGTVLESKLSNPVKVSGANSKNSKTSIRPTLKKATAMASNERPRLTQSRTFPAKGLGANAISKSVNGRPTQSSAKHSGATRLQASTGLSTNGESRSSASIRQSTLAFVPSVRQTTSVKPVSTNGAAPCPPPEGFSSADQPSISNKTTLSSTEEDAHSLNSSKIAACHSKSITPGFSSRLEERAEKRREFFSKLEEKIHAKEVEKNNMQEKSKESQEAEIKTLRKSLKFKAAPLPSFYKEPPPKVEFKKMPTTRAKSPKLGRRKSSGDARNSLEGGSGLSPRVSREQDTSTKVMQVNDKNHNVSTKKPARKSLPNLHSRESISAKTEGKSGKLKHKATVAKGEDVKANTNEEQESKTHSVNPPELKDVEPEKNPAQDNELLVNLANPSAQDNEVIVSSGDPDISLA